MKINALDSSIILLYFVAIIGLGIWISRRQAKGGREFFLAGNSMRWPFIGASLFATNISSQQFVGQAGLAFTVGIIAGGFQIIGAVCFIFLAAFFIRIYMGLKLATSPEFFEKRYSGRCRTIVSFINLMMIILGNIAAALYAGALVLTHLLGWDQMENANLLYWVSVFLIGIAAGTYTLMGGLKAVIYCDFVQMIVLMLGGALLLFFGIQELGGIDAIFASKEATTGESMWSLVRPWNHSFGWLPMLTGAFVLGVHGHCTDQDYVQRALSAGNIYHAKMGALFAGVLKTLALLFIAAPGVVAAQLFVDQDIVARDNAYVSLLTNVMPTGLLGLCLAGLLAAIMSSVDSGLCACGSLLTFDFFAKIKKNATEKELLKDGRIIMVVLLVVCMLIAPFIRNFKGLFDYLLAIWAFLAPGVFVTVLFGLFYKRATERAAYWTLVVGCVLGFAAFCLLNLPALADIKSALPLHFQNKLNLSPLIVLICICTMVGISRLGKKTEQDIEKAKLVTIPDGQFVMSEEENKKYQRFLVGLLIFIASVVALFSPIFF
ncbi:SLC5 family protein [Pelagicoccus mobilis]|uniref:Sodium/solute symporter n=1 Tax=Pelagicoccus mobilis TaxID=415221 RepID=A0A934VR38_9BACT|nr:sodium/solute symporter [Pelagicoccus mobilis]MBK1878992.1 sodium/solute symporter [Pelagicoccus mobilis]